ncbi:MAG: flagellar biosynthesis protein FlhF [Halioglobus sp.]|nr:flagellar biosynthesis protein FlhF [Halioglobus sp.]
MKIKRYIDKDSRSAMARVRAEMGADAVILSNKNVNGQVELVAARDFDETALQSGLAASAAGEAASDAPSLVELQRELAKLRGLVEGELSQMQWREMAGRPSVKTALRSRLGKLGLSRAVAGSIIDRLPPQGALDELWQQALGLLAAQLPVLDGALHAGGNIVALVGSTGVGKTTTVAKLAARAVLRHGGRQVALITTDCYRIGGQEQLETFAGYLGIPMLVATDGAQLRAALDELSSRKLVLIDTAGMSQRDIRLYEQFATLNSVGYDIAAHVVLSATAQPGALNEVVQVFGREALAGAILTKLDEATSLGGVLDTVVRNRLPLAYFSTGQKVPEDIVPARAEYLINQAVEHAKADAAARQRRAASTRQASTHGIAV